MNNDGPCLIHPVDLDAENPPRCQRHGTFCGQPDLKREVEAMYDDGASRPGSDA